jgi:VanZ family protein
MFRWLVRVAELRAVRLACFGLAIAMTVNLFYLGAGPGAVNLFVSPWDKVAHFAAFSVLSGLLAVGIGLRRPWLTLAVVALIGLADELHQRWLPGRSAGVDDWIVDMMAGLCAVGLIWIMRSLAARGSPVIDPVR